MKILTKIWRAIRNFIFGKRLDIKHLQDSMLLLCDEMQSNLYGKGGHFPYLSGKVAVITTIIKSLNYISCEKDKKMLLDFCQEALLQIGREQYGDVKESYFNFDTMTDKS